jgi:CRP/FNR family cyclic AMP-dependent transcriptional regulator
MRIKGATLHVAMSSPPPRRRAFLVAPRPSKAPLKSHAFNVELFLDSAGPGRWVAKLKAKETVFSQGDLGKYVMYLREGAVKLTVVNTAGKEAVVEILGPGDFFGVRCLAGRSVYTATATAIVPTTVLVIEKGEMIRLLHAEHAVSDRFIANMLARSARGEAALIDQLFNSSEKRLARVLLLLARYGEQGETQKMLPKLSQEMLAEMIGTTRSRINFFMNKFRKLGFIEYGGKLRGLQVNKSLLGVVLQG